MASCIGHVISDYGSDHWAPHHDVAVMYTTLYWHSSIHSTIMTIGWGFVA